MRGWSQFVRSMNDLHTVGFTMFVAAAFVVGRFVQELADWSVKKLGGERFLKSDETKFGREERRGRSEARILAESGLALGNVDSAFDYCLTRIGESFPKRDVFVATSDFARSFLVLAVCGVAPSVRVAFDRSHSVHCFVLVLAVCVTFLAAIARLAWIA